MSEDGSSEVDGRGPAADPAATLAAAAQGRGSHEEGGGEAAAMAQPEAAAEADQQRAAAEERSGEQPADMEQLEGGEHEPQSEEGGPAVAEARWWLEGVPAEREQAAAAEEHEEKRQAADTEQQPAAGQESEAGEDGPAAAESEWQQEDEPAALAPLEQAAEAAKSEPSPAAAEPELAAAEPKQSAAEPELAAAEPEPLVTEPEPLAMAPSPAPQQPPMGGSPPLCHPAVPPAAHGELVAEEDAEGGSSFEPAREARLSAVPPCAAPSQGGARHTAVPHSHPPAHSSHATVPAACAGGGELTFSRPPYVPRAKPYARADYSHSAVALMKIAHDNQLLVQRLAAISHKGAPPGAQQGPAATAPPPCTLASSSAINRRKQAGTIAQENHALYQRLVAIQPSKDISRETLEAEHRRNEGYRLNCATFKLGGGGAGRHGGGGGGRGGPGGGPHAEAA